MRALGKFGFTESLDILRLLCLVFGNLLFYSGVN
jgi:hypothetical protein